MSRVILKRLTLFTASAVAATTTYEISSYGSGNHGLLTTKSKDSIELYFNQSKNIQKYIEDPQFEQVSRNNNLCELGRDKGGVSEPTFTFRNTNDPKNTVTFAHCGPKTVGFPFIVHGGLLGSLLRHSVQVASNQMEPLPGKFQIRYLQPTIMDEVLKIETKGDPEGLKLYISYPKSPDSPLVEATYTV